MKLVTYLEKFDLLDRVEAAAGDEFDKLKLWKFALNYRAKSRYGCCKTAKKFVEVTSEYYVRGEIKDGEMDDFINTLLHETAHAIVHERYGHYRWGGVKMKSHGHEWRSIMRLLGVTRIASTGKSKVLKDKRKKTAKHKYTCHDCGYEYYSQRRLKNLKNRYHSGCKRKPNGGAFIHQQLR